MSNKTNTGVSQAQLKASIGALVAKVSKLAPHPSNPQMRGPVFVKVDPSLMAAPSCDDSTLGETLSGMFLGAVFGGMLPGWMQGIDFGDMIDAYDEVCKDRFAARPGALRGAFSGVQTRADLEAAWRRDLPHRMQLERQIATLLQKVQTVSAPRPAVPAFALAA